MVQLSAATVIQFAEDQRCSSQGILYKLHSGLPERKVGVSSLGVSRNFEVSHWQIGKKKPVYILTWIKLSNIFNYFFFCTIVCILPNTQPDL